MGWELNLDPLQKQQVLSTAITAWSVHCERKLGLVPSSRVTANKHWVRFWAQDYIGVYGTRQEGEFLCE